MATAKRPHAASGAASSSGLDRTLPAAPWDLRLQRAVILFGRLMLGLLFLTQMAWKLPPSYGCGPGYTFTTVDAGGTLVRGEGLCDWVGLESVYAGQDRAVLGVNIKPLAQLNGLFIDSVVKPTIAWFGTLIFLAELFVAVSMLLGLLTRAGGLLAIGISTQLLIGLGNIPSPYEWEWSYLLMVTLAVLMAGLAPGRLFGLDQLLRPRLWASAENGSRLARLALLLT